MDTSNFIQFVDLHYAFDLRGQAVGGRPYALFCSSICHMPAPDLRGRAVGGRPYISKLQYPGVQHGLSASACCCDALVTIIVLVAVVLCLHRATAPAVTLTLVA